MVHPADPLPEPSAPRVEVDLDVDRGEWAVITLLGPFDRDAAVQALGSAILDLLLEGNRLVAVDLRRASPLALGTCRTLAAAGDLVRRCEGCLVVTVADAFLAASLRALDDAGAYEVVAPRSA